ncbi:hypothetical protein E2I00_011514, partial [Balaenoptera physalus]
ESRKFLEGYCCASLLRSQKAKSICKVFNLSKKRMSIKMLLENHCTKKLRNPEPECPNSINSLLRKIRKRLKNTLNFWPREWKTKEKCQEHFQETEATLSKSFYASLSQVKNKIF